MPVIFEDNRIHVENALSSAIEQFLEEAADLVVSATKENASTRVETGNTRRNWKHIVDMSSHTATIGNPLENAVWEEFGTGEHALNNDGRKGGWYIPAEKLSPKAKSKMRKTVIKGKEFYFTRGKKPIRALHNAYHDNKNRIIRRAEQVFGERMK